MMMWRTQRLRSVNTLLVLVSVVTLVLAVVIPHYHAALDQSLSDSDDTCRGCEISDGLSAAPVTLPVIDVTPTWIVFYSLHPRAIPRLATISSSTLSRAPPVFS